MKIKNIQISNILSFKYYENIAEAQLINLNPGINIFIGHNGSGKSTFLEILNFVFKYVLFKETFINYQLIFSATIIPDDLKRIIDISQTANYNSFRLTPSWNTPDNIQTIKITILTDQTDRENFQIIKDNYEVLLNFSRTYSSRLLKEVTELKDVYSFEIRILPSRQIEVADIDAEDTGFIYFRDYNYLKALIEVHNHYNPGNRIPSFSESFTQISGYRNYNAFNPSVSLTGDSADNMIQNIRRSDYSKSINSVEQSEPAIFNVVRLSIAGAHFNNFGPHNEAEADTFANNLPLIRSINEKLKIINIKIEVKLINKSNWNYSISILDITRNKIISDINILSAGQKSIMHLIFESFGHGELHGGLILIDEPEIHLHYQFQQAYLQIIEEISKSMNCQYIMVTHSESLINSNTIHNVIRFALDQNNFTKTHKPVLQPIDKTLIKILDNTKSTFVLFTQKVVLVEGDTDRYFFSFALKLLYPAKYQIISVLNMGGKGNYTGWRSFFKSYGMAVYYIGDFDNVFSIPIDGNPFNNRMQIEILKNDLMQNKLNNLSPNDILAFNTKLNTLMADADRTKPNRSLWKPLLDDFIRLAKISNDEIINEVKSRYPSIDDLINNYYSEKIFLLKKGAIENYTHTVHGDLGTMVRYCENSLPGWINGHSEDSNEIKSILSEIIA